MKMRVGGGEDSILSAELPRRCRLDLLEDGIRARLITEGELRIPWDLALLLLDLYESEQRPEHIAQLRQYLPGWLSDDDTEILMDAVVATRLPSHTPLQLKLRVTGRAGSPGYGHEVDWVGAAERRISEAPKVSGGLIRHGNSPARRLSFGQFQLLQSLAQMPPLGHNRNEDLLATDRLRAAFPESDAGVLLDPFLAQDRVLRVDGVEPRLIPTDNGSAYQVRPHVEGVPDKDLENYFLGASSAELGQRVLPVRTQDGGRTRIVFTERGRKALHDARRLGQITPVQAAAALSHPKEFFGENFDLSAFSERVTGLGPRIRSVAPILREIPTYRWWDWDEEAAKGVDEPDLEKALQDPETRRTLQRLIAEADHRNEAFVPDPIRPGGFIAITPDVRAAVENVGPKEPEQAAAGPLKTHELEDAAATGNTSAQKISQKTEELVLQVKENLEDNNFGPGRMHLVQKPRMQIPLPPGLRHGVHLYDHQKEGYSWLAALNGATLAAGTWRGALLADDMGLGKTLQVLCCLSQMSTMGRNGPHLIVAPVALLQNWQLEAQRFFGSTFEPILQVRGRDLPENQETAAARLAAHRLVLISYETLRQQEFVLARVNWDTVVLDEAQKAKDPATQVARVVRTLKARFRLAMTGTPVENTLKELWTLYDWALPGLLDSLRTFAETFIKPLIGAATQDRSDLSAKLHDRIRPVFLRRMKHDALKDQLPPIEWHSHQVQLDAAQQEGYSRQITQARANAKRGQALGTLIRLFGICAHPRLDENVDEMPSLREMSFPKAEKLFELLRQIEAKQEKVLVFANRIRLQRWLSEEIERQFDVPVSVINGDINESTKRIRMIDEFSARPGFGVIVLAPRAAGLGLNITAANHVIHYTREWNPAVENQATDRAYRIGQDRTVHVHTIVTTSPAGRTVEENLDRLLEEKRRLMRDFIVPMGGFDITQDEILAQS